MNKNQELLNYLYQNTQMGLISLDTIIPKLQDYTSFKALLTDQRKEYKAINDLSKKLANEKNITMKELPKCRDLMTKMMINMKLMTRKNESTISEMLILGANMGIIDAIKRIKDYKSADNDLLETLRNLLNFEEETLRQYKNYL